MNANERSVSDMSKSVNKIVQHCPINLWRESLLLAREELRQIKEREKALIESIAVFEELVEDAGTERESVPANEG